MARRRPLVHNGFRNGSIGRITTTGRVEQLQVRNAGIAARRASRPGPDGALWFTNEGSDSIGRITTGGTITNVRPTPASAGRSAITAGATALSGSPTRAATVDRADYDSRPRSRTTCPRASAARGASPQGRTAPSGSPTGTTVARGHTAREAGKETRSVGRPAARSRASRMRAFAARSGSSRGPDGALWLTNYRGTLDRADHDRRHRHGPSGTRASAGLATSPRGRTVPSGSRTGDTIGRIDRDPRQRQQLQALEHPRPVGDRGRAGRCALVHQLPGRHDRADTPPAPSRTFPGRQHSWAAGDRGGAGRRALVRQLPGQLPRADHHGRCGRQRQARDHRQAVGDRRRAGRRHLVHQSTATTRLVASGCSRHGNRRRRTTCPGPGTKKDLR